MTRRNIALCAVRPMGILPVDMMYRSGLKAALGAQATSLCST